VPFPAWVDPVWRNCLVGCMICQRACPEKKEFLGWIEEGAEFSKEETALLLNLRYLLASELSRAGGCWHRTCW
jgi:formate hydrogenlyase subunit 6/NADH:ubiquinone oxidoreductase subunit I